MSELFPSSGENNETESAVCFDDVMRSPNWSLFCDAVGELENSLILYGRDELDHRMQALQEEVIELGDLIGYEYHGESCYVDGLAYDECAEGDEGAESILLSTKEATFIGCDLQYIDRQWRVLLEVEVMHNEAGSESQTSDDLAGKTLAQMYYILPNKHHLMSLRISPGEDVDGESDDMSENVEVVKYLHSMAEDATERIAQPDFLILSFEDQRALLDEYLTNLDADFPRQLRSSQILIDCTGYYTGYVDMPGMTFKDHTDWSDEAWQGTGQRLLRGEVTGFSYPELEDVSADQSLTSASFVHSGVPCVDLATDDPSIMYHVPLSAIRNFI